MSLKDFNFNVHHTQNYARVGIIETHRGNINTPAFMPVGTQATVKGVFLEDIKKTGSEIILSNTYHLMIRPGVERIESVGGLHEFMNCDLPILTDSGGFQVMSLSKLNKIDRDKGAIFTNSSKIKKSMELSSEWAKRSKDAFGINDHKGLFGIVQGGLFNDLRVKSLNKLIEIGFNGYALGGLAVGETQDEMFDVLDGIKDHMPKDKPRYLMGVGTPSDILGAVKRGVDMFDCVMPTRSGRTGLAFTWEGQIQIRNSKYKNDNTPLDKNVTKFNLNKYSKNYLNHLFNTNEMLASMILTLNNINFYQDLMRNIRDNIKHGTFDEFHDKYINKL